jgi:hypothetical protein
MAVDCNATGGHREGQPAWTVRHVSYSGNRMVVTGDFGERYFLTCASSNPGLVCRGTTGALDILVLANGAYMLESISEPISGREQLAHSYSCNGAIDPLP